MLKPFTRFFPGEEAEQTEIEIEMAGFSIRIAHGSKIYQDANDKDRKVAVWRYSTCLTKLREARRGDPYLHGALENMQELHEKYNQTDEELTKRWWADCTEVWQKAFDKVLEEPLDDGDWQEPEPEAPQAEPPKRKGLFKR